MYLYLANELHFSVDITRKSHPVAAGIRALRLRFNRLLEELATNMRAQVILVQFNKSAPCVCMCV